MNHITIVGRICSTPETQSFVTKKGENSTLTKFRLASNQNGKKDKSNFFFCTAFGHTGEAIVKYCEVGDQIIAHGTMNSNVVNYEDGTSQTYWDVSIDTFEFGAKKKETEEGETNSKPQKSFTPAKRQRKPMVEVTDTADLPF